MNEQIDTAVHLPMPEGRRRVLYAVRRRGEATADEIARQLEMTLSGARQHLSALVSEGLLETTEAASTARPGRPALVYRVAPAGEVHFPKAYGELTNELLGYLDDEQEGVVDRLFARRREHRIAAARERIARHDTLEGKVGELTRVLDEDGYMASWERTGPDEFRISEHNCAIWAVAQRYGQCCTSEIEFLRAVVPDADIERVKHKINGEPLCAYVVRSSS